MTDKPLFNLDADDRWRLAYDSQPWVIQRQAQNPCVRRFKSHVVRDSGWRGVSFVGGKKATLGRLYREKGIILTSARQPEPRNHSRAKRLSRGRAFYEGMASERWRA